MSLTQLGASKSSIPLPFGRNEGVALGARKFASFQTLQKVTQHAIPFLPVGTACEMTLLAVDLEVSSIHSRSLQFRHHLGRDARGKQFVGARQHVEHFRADLREVLLGVVM